MGRGEESGVNRETISRDTKPDSLHLDWQKPLLLSQLAIASLSGILTRISSLTNTSFRASRAVLPRQEMITSTTPLRPANRHPAA